MQRRLFPKGEGYQERRRFTRAREARDPQPPPEHLHANVPHDDDAGEPKESRGACDGDALSIDVCGFA